MAFRSYEDRVKISDILKFNQSLIIMDIRKYILPVYVQKVSYNNEVSQSLIGNGFLIKDYFITAYHVIGDSQDPYDKSNPFIVIDGQKFELNKSKAHTCKSTPYDKNGNPIGHENKINGDFIAYHIPGLRSPLQLAKYAPQKGEVLDCCFFHNAKPTNVLELPTDDSKPYYWKTKGTVFGPEGFSGDFFGASFTPTHPTDGGSSGSPLLKDNIVYGILHAGNPNDEDDNNKPHPEICIFYAAYAVGETLYRETK